MRVQLILSLLISWIFVSKYNLADDSLEFVTDFLLRQKSPTKVTGFLCWSKSRRKTLLQNIHKRGISFSVKMANTTTLSISNIFPEEYQLFVLDLGCLGWQVFFDKANNLKLFNHPYRWLIVNDQNTSSNLFSRLHVYCDSKVYFANYERTSSNFLVTTPYKYGEDTGIVNDDVAVWNVKSRFKYYNDLTIPRNRSNLRGLPLTCSYVLMDLDSINHMWDYRNPQVDTVTKLNSAFVHFLADMMNASKSFITQTTWGYNDSSTSLFSGMIGDLQVGNAEIGGSPSYFIKDRIDIIDYLAPTSPTQAKFIFRAPPLSYVTNVFTLTFERSVWISCFGLLVVTALVLYLIVFWEWQNPKFNENKSRQETRLRANLVDVVLAEISGLCQQGSDTEPRSVSGRIAFIFVFLLLMYIYTAFSANIVALLQTTSNSIKTLEDLLNSRIKLGVENTPYGIHYFSTATEPIRKAIYEQKVSPKGQPSNIIPLEKGIARLKNEFFAFHCLAASGYKVIGDTFEESEKCGLKEIQYLQVIEPWLVGRKNSTYKEIMKVGLRKIHERGIQSREIRRYLIKKPECHGKGNNFMSVGLLDCYYAFLVYATGAFIAVMVFFAEIAREKYSRYKKKPQNELNANS